MKRKSMVQIATAMMLMAALIVGGTLAYFTDTDAQTNTFTAGKVGIKLDEVIVESDDNDNLVGTGERTEESQEYKLHPGIVVDKDPTITVDEDSLDAYVGAVVKVRGDLYDLIGIEGYDTINIHALASGGLLADQEGAAYGDYEGLFVFQNDTYAIHQQAISAENPEDNVWVMYIFMKEPMAAGEDVVLFDTLTIPAAWDNAEMAKINGMQIDVNAFAAQTEGFDSCYEALTSAFPDQFNFSA